MSDQLANLRWRSLADGGLEHVAVKATGTGVTAEGVTIAGTGDDSFGLRVRITADPDWAGFKSLHLTRLGGPTVALRHDGLGGWTDSEGKTRKEFDGVHDLMLDGSAIWITAMVRRAAWKAGAEKAIDVVRVAVPSLEIRRETLKVTAVEPGRLYRIVATDGEAEVALDEAGYVTRWADRIERIGGVPAQPPAPAATPEAAC